VKQFHPRCLAIILLACALLSAAPLRAQNYPLASGTRWTFHSRKEVGPGAHFDGEDGRVAKNNVVDTTMIAHVGGNEQIGGKTYTRIEALREDKLANVDWLAVTPAGLMHAKTVDYIADSEADFDPPEVLLSPTLAPGESWIWRDPKSSATSKKTVSAPEQVSVPARSYRAIPVRTVITIPTDGEPVISRMTQWFVPGIGYIKSEIRMEIAGHLLMHNTVTLEKFEPASKK
jgi:hypothetical protein